MTAAWPDLELRTFDEIADDLVWYVLLTRRDERFTDEGIVAALRIYLDELAAVDDELVDADAGPAT